MANSKIKFISAVFLVSVLTFLSNVPFSLAESCTLSDGTVLQNTPTGECLSMWNGTPSGSATSNTNKAGTASAPNSNASKYFPGLTTDSGIQEYIRAIYMYAIGVVGIIATIVIMIGGLIWISSMGNAARVTSAKDWIGGALSGLALAMFSYTILFIINPDLVSFNPLNPKTINSTDKSVPDAMSSKIYTSLSDCRAECKSPDICQAATAGGYNCVKEIKFDRDTNSQEYPTTNGCKEYKQGSFEWDICCEYNNCHGTNNDEYNQGWIEG